MHAAQQTWQTQIAVRHDNDPSIYQSAQQIAIMTPRSFGQFEPSSTGGRRTRHVINSSRTTRRRRGTYLLCAHADKPRLARQEGCLDASLRSLTIWSADQSRHYMWRIGRSSTHYGGPYRAADQAGPDNLGRAISPAPMRTQGHCVSQWPRTRMGRGE